MGLLRGGDTAGKQGSQLPKGRGVGQGPQAPEEGAPWLLRDPQKVREVALSPRCVT